MLNYKAIGVNKADGVLTVTPNRLDALKASDLVIREERADTPVEKCRARFAGR
jgi:hypothetical protein